MAHLAQSMITPLSNDPSKETRSDTPRTSSEVMRAANLRTIDLGRLQKGDEAEALKLFEACKDDGVFYLDFSSEECIKMMDKVKDLFTVSKGLFELSEEEKMRFDIDNLGRLKLNGYKPVGRNFGGINGKSDGFESYTIPGKPHLYFPLIRPDYLTTEFSHATSFCTETNNVLSLLLSSLSSSLKLSPNASLGALHRADAPSPDIVRLLHYFPQPVSEMGDPQTPHTDLGSLTLLFTGSPGLQVLAPKSKEWAFVMLKPNCGVVNVGDGLSMLTGGLLHSCLHRVRPLPGRAMEERYSLAYLQRTEDAVKMKPLPGLKEEAGDAGAGEKEVYTSQQWLEIKFGMLRAKTHKEDLEGQKILTGRGDAILAN